MKERPILFSELMVKAILDGRKTQTRRVVKPQPDNDLDLLLHSKDCLAGGEHEGKTSVWKCPYGNPGDRLWVRETYYQIGHWEEVPNVKTKSGRSKWRFVPDNDAIRFDAPKSYRKGRHHKDPATSVWHKRLGRFMPRKASRITLEVTGIRVERQKYISEGDAKREGMECVLNDEYCEAEHTSEMLYSHRAGFKDYLKHHGHMDWNANPWVWVVEFRRCDNG